jgi:hypothetical protein
MILLILLILSSIWAFGSTMTLMTYASEGENKNVVNNNMLFNLQALASISMLIWGFYKLYSQIEIGLLWYVVVVIVSATFLYRLADFLFQLQISTKFNFSMQRWSGMLKHQINPQELTYAINLTHVYSLLPILIFTMYVLLK